MVACLIKCIIQIERNEKQKITYRFVKLKAQLLLHGADFLVGRAWERSSYEHPTCLLLLSRLVSRIIIAPLAFRCLYTFFPGLGYFSYIPI